MADPQDEAPISSASRRKPLDEDQDSIRQQQQRPDHQDRHHGPPQQVPEGPPQVPDYDLASQPIVGGRQPARPGQPGRWEPEPGDRDAPGTERDPERRPHGQHEKA
jgi:hypothetical protein